MAHLVVTGEHNGILRTYDLFTAYSPGYFLLTVLASDPAGHNATATVGVYILRQVRASYNIVVYKQ